MTGSHSECVSFGQWMKQYQAETRLRSTLLQKRQHQGRYPKIEEKLVAYIQLWQQKYKDGKTGLSWVLLREKCLEWSELLVADGDKYKKLKHLMGSLTTA